MKKVLVVDDVRVNRRVLAMLLQQVGYECVEASDAESARTAFAAGDIGWVVADWRMPGADGVELVRALRAEPAAAGVRFALLTGDRLRIPDEGALFDAVLTKPVALEDLEKFIRGEGA